MDTRQPSNGRVWHVKGTSVVNVNTLCSEKTPNLVSLHNSYALIIAPDPTQLNCQLSWVESDHQSDHSTRRAMITLTTEKNWSRSTSKSFPPVAQFWSCSEFPRLSWDELGRIGRYDHAKNWTTELWPSFQLLANSSSHRLGISIAQQKQ